MAWQRIAATTGLPFALELANFSIADVSSLTNLATTQSDDDDLFEGDPLDLGPFPRWADPGHTVAVNQFLLPCDRAASARRLFSIRC